MGIGGNPVSLCSLFVSGSCVLVFATVLLRELVIFFLFLTLGPANGFFSLGGPG